MRYHVMRLDDLSGSSELVGCHFCIEAAETQRVQQQAVAKVHEYYWVFPTTVCACPNRPTR